MNWNSPVAEEVFALAFGLRFDSRIAVLSRYSKPAPVDARGIADRAGDPRRDIRGRPADAGRNIDWCVGAHGRALTGRTPYFPAALQDGRLW